MKSSVFNLNELDCFKFKIGIEVTQIRNQKRKSSFFFNLKKKSILSNEFILYRIFICAWVAGKYRVLYYSILLPPLLYSITPGSGAIEKARPGTVSISL